MLVKSSQWKCRKSETYQYNDSSGADKCIQQPSFQRQPTTEDERKKEIQWNINTANHTPELRKSSSYYLITGNVILLKCFHCRDQIKDRYRYCLLKFFTNMQLNKSWKVILYRWAFLIMILIELFQYLQMFWSSAIKQISIYFVFWSPCEMSSAKRS